MVEFDVWAGLDPRQIATDIVEVPVHRAVVPFLEELRRKAAEVGFELKLASGYRSFERQLHIWNAKAEGHRPVLNDHGERLDVSRLSEKQLLFAILRWSALPGGSRHHWGCDVDVYEGRPARAGYELQLTYEETQPGAVFGDFYQWLNQELERPETVFFRPYQSWEGGVAPEPWHLSCAPLAADYQQSISRSLLRDLIAASDIALKETILAHFDEIFRRFIWVNWQHYPVAFRPSAAESSS